MYKNMLFVNYPDEALDNSFIYPIYLERELARWLIGGHGHVRCSRARSHFFIFILLPN